MKNLALHIALIGACSFTWAQSDTSVQNVLDEIQLSDNRMESLAVGHVSTVMADTQLVGGQSSTFTEVLFANHANHIRSFGPGLSATFSSRGSSSSQVNLFWNNLPLNSPGLGSTDIGLLPSNGFSLTQVNGGGSTFFGNQAMGATVNVEQNGFNKPQGLRIGGGMGSFGKYFGNLTGKFGTNRWQNTLSVDYLSAENDFEYEYREATHKRKNADVQLLNITNQLDYRFSPKSNLRLAYWGTFADRGSPSSFVPTTPATSRLEDENHKVVAVLSQRFQKGLLSLTQGFLTEKQRFFNDNLDEVNSTKNVVTKASYSLPLRGDWYVFFGIDNIYTMAEGQSKSSAQQNNLAAFGSVKYQGKRLLAVLAARQEFIDSEIAPFSPSLSLEYEFIKNLKAVGNISYNFRYPTLNDRFWTVGGNPDLKPEQGWNGEAGLSYQWSWINASVTYYKQNIDNFIQWVPGANGIWSPENVKQVSIEGVESEVGFQHKFQKLETQLTFGYNYNNSVVVTSDLPNDASVGKQLIYNPQNKISSHLNVSYKQLRFLLSYIYTDEVYARADNDPLSRLEAFGVLNTEVSYRLNIKKTKVDMHVSILNLTNQEYQTIKNYPMPGINFNTGITLSI